MTCDPARHRSETLFWDAMNYKVWHPETISYSIIPASALRRIKVSYNLSEFRGTNSPCGFYSSGNPYFEFEIQTTLTSNLLRDTFAICTLPCLGSALNPGTYYQTFNRYDDQLLWQVPDLSTYAYFARSNYTETVLEDIHGQKIIVNGNEFDLIDASSIQLKCTDPIGCPEGTIECDCGDYYCCYEKQGLIYKKVASVRK